MKYIRSNNGIRYGCIANILLMNSENEQILRYVNIDRL